MNPKKFYFTLLGLSALSILAIVGGMYLASSMLQSNSTRLVNARLESRVIEEREKYYIQAQLLLKQYKDLGSTLSKVLPKDKDEAKAVAELYRITDESGTKIVRIAFPASTLGQKTSTSKSSASAAVTQSKPLEGVKGVYFISTNIEIEGKSSKTISYGQILNTLEKIEKNRRNMQITTIDIRPTEDAGRYELTLGINLFVKP